jgi:predicted membrane GTPase involved in stress response
VVNQTFELFDRIGATEAQLDFPVVYASALNGWATTDVKVAKAGVKPKAPTCVRCSKRYWRMFPRRSAMPMVRCSSR